MKYLLDVNVLVAFGVTHHEFHRRVVGWVRGQPNSTVMATCSITELGFVRILSQVPAYGLTIVQARTQLLRIKKEIPLALLADSHDISRLPAWVKFPKQITGGHLLELARANGALLATLDEILPADAYLIP